MPRVEVRWTTIECGVRTRQQDISCRILADVVQRSGPRVGNSRSESVREAPVELKLQSTVVGASGIGGQPKERKLDVLIKQRLRVEQSSSGSADVRRGERLMGAEFALETNVPIKRVRQFELGIEYDRRRTEPTHKRNRVGKRLTRSLLAQIVKHGEAAAQDHLRLELVCKTKAWCEVRVSRSP